MCKTFLVWGTPEKKGSAPYNYANPSVDNIMDIISGYGNLVRSSHPGNWNHKDPLGINVKDKPLTGGLIRPKWETASFNNNTTGNNPKQFETFTTSSDNSFVSDMLDHASYFSASSLLKQQK